MPPHQHGSHHGDTRLIRHAYGEGESMSRWSSARKRCGMNSPATTKKIPFLYALASLTLARLIPHFSPTSPTAPNSGNSTLKSSMRKGLWPAGRKYASRTTTSAYLRLIPVFAQQLAIKTWIQLAKEAGCAQLFNCPVTAIRHDDEGVTIETADGEYQAKKRLSAREHG